MFNPTDPRRRDRQPSNRDRHSMTRSVAIPLSLPEMLAMWNLWLRGLFGGR